MSVQFRSAETQDVSAIAEIWHEGWHSGHAEICPAELTALRTLDSFLDRTADHLSKTTVAVLDGRIIGFFMLKQTEIYQFYVARAGRGTGVAADLMAAAEQGCLACGIMQPWLACSIGNDRAARFYEKCGWVRSGTVIEQLEVSTGTFPLEVWTYQKALA